MPMLRPVSKPALLALTLSISFSVSTAWAAGEQAARYYEDALQRYERGDLPGAVIQLKNTIQRDPKMLAAQVLLGKALLASGEIKAAEAAFDEALRQGVSLSEIALPLAQTYLSLGEYRKLLDKLPSAGLAPALQAELLSLRGTAFAMLGSTTQAQTSFAEARRLAPSLAAPLIGEALLLMRGGELAQARALAQQATTLAPTMGSAWHTLGTLQQAAGETAAALASFDRALAAETGHVNARIAKSALLIGLGRGDEADKELALLNGMKLSDARASFLRGRLAAERGQAQAATKSFTEAVNLVDALPVGIVRSDEPLMMAAAMSHQALGNTEKARDYLKHLLILNPRHLAGGLLLSGIALEARDYATAQPLLDNLRRAHPNHPDVLYRLGSLHMARKQFLQASEYFERAASSSVGSDALRELGLAQLGLGEGSSGIASLEKALARNPGDLMAAVQLSMTLARSGQHARALQIAQDIVKRDPDNLAMLNFLGNIKGRSGDKRGAREAFESVLKKSTEFRPAGINLSWLDIEEQRFEPARLRLTKMLERVKNDPDVLFQLGVLEQRAGRHSEALRHWSSANSSQRSDPRAGLAIVELHLAQQDSAKALQTAKELMAVYPGNLNVMLALGRTHLAAGDPLRARATFKDATRVAEFDSEHQVMIGRLQLMAGGIDDAAYNVQKALQARADHIGAMVLDVEVEFRRRDPARADAALRRLSSKHPGALPTLLTQGNAAMGRGNYAAAAGHYRSAMAKAPDTGIALLLSRALIASGNNAAALKELQSWQRKAPQDMVALRALAEVQLQAGELAAAKKSYAELVRRAPSDAGIHASYAQLLQQLGDPSAVATAEKALSLAPQDPFALDTLGWILVQQRQLDAGLRYLRDARLRRPQDPEMRFHLAYALHLTGRADEARGELGAALSTHPALAERPIVKQLKRDLGMP